MEGDDEQPNSPKKDKGKGRATIVSDTEDEEEDSAISEWTKLPRGTQVDEERRETLRSIKDETESEDEGSMDENFRVVDNDGKEESEADESDDDGAALTKKLKSTKAVDGLSQKVVSKCDIRRVRGLRLTSFCQGEMNVAHADTETIRSSVRKPTYYVAGTALIVV